MQERKEIARVTLEIALNKEFDYQIPRELADRVEVGTRVRVPFGPRQVLGCVTALLERFSPPGVAPHCEGGGTPALITARVLELARWMATYYCCSLDAALRSVLPEAVRKEDASWRERMFVHALPQPGGTTGIDPGDNRRSGR
jgi:primosomal protein N' (replication factor Y) (superfamily II helicase)